MKKAQFASPIILILLIVSYFMITSELSRIQSSMIKSRTALLKVSNSIKEIEELDLEWQASITVEALRLLSRHNSSGTVSQLLGLFNASILFERSPMLLNYTKTYAKEDLVKTINGTIIVPYPYSEFVEAEARIRQNCPTITQACAEASISNQMIKAELADSAIFLNHSAYPLSFSYRYIILLD